MSNLNRAKCSQCGCTGIHACMGKPLKKGVDMSQYSMYSTLGEAINHIRKSEEKRTRRGRKNDNNDSRS